MRKEVQKNEKDHKDCGKPDERGVTVIINKKRHHFDLSTICPDEIRKAAGLDETHEVWQVVGSPDPEGELPKDDIQVTDCIEVKNGTHFRVVPPGTFGAPQGASTLDTEVEELRHLGYEVEVQPDGQGYAVVLKGYSLPTGYTVEKTDLLVRIPQGYPHANPDMFWVETGVLLEGGKIPEKAEHLENHVGRRWRRFSWHINKYWHPGKDSLSSYLDFVHVRLAKKV